MDDEFSLNVGDSLRRSIERGLAKSRYGIIIVSKNFFAKEWPQKELDALIGISTGRRKNSILPIWHKVNQDYVKKRSPVLGSIVAITTDKGLEQISEELFSTIIQDKKRSPAIFSSYENQIDPYFKTTFEKNINEIVKLLEDSSWHEEVNNLIDLLIMLIKERIEKWDVPSIKFATKEIFLIIQIQ